MVIPFDNFMPSTLESGKRFMAKLEPKEWEYSCNKDTLVTISRSVPSCQDR